MNFKQLEKALHFAKVNDPTMQAFHKAMHEDQEEATNHLVFADWLEEQGKPEHAAVIRTDAGQEEPDRHITTARNWGKFDPGEFKARRDSDTGTLVSLFNHSLQEPGKAFWWDKYYSSPQEANEAYQKLIQEGAIGEKPT